MGKHSEDKCEICGKTVKDLLERQEMVFVSYAVNPKNKKKGMWLCPTHEAQEVKKQYGSS